MHCLEDSRTVADSEINNVVLLQAQGPHRIVRTVCSDSVRYRACTCTFADTPSQPPHSDVHAQTKAQSGLDNYAQKNAIVKLLDVGMCPEHASTGSGCEG